MKKLLLSLLVCFTCLNVQAQTPREIYAIVSHQDGAMRILYSDNTGCSGVSHSTVMVSRLGIQTWGCWERKYDSIIYRGRDTTYSGNSGIPSVSIPEIRPISELIILPVVRWQ